MTEKRRRTRKAGFSLLELSMVMFLMMILLGFSLPRFSLVFESDLQKTVNKIAYILNDLKVQAILRGESYKLAFDVSKSEYSVLTQDFSSLQYHQHEKYPKPIPLGKSVKFYNISRDREEDIERQTFAFDEIEFEELFGQKHEFRINSSGLIDLFTIKLQDEKNQLSLSVVNVMGKIVIGEETPL